MDHLHDSGGCPKLFLLATGDQDFIPLIQRIVVEGASVVLIVASTSKLSPEYRSIASQPNITLLSITDVVELRPIPTVSGERSGACILGLLRLCMSGGILGGAQDRNTKLLVQWDLLTPRSDEELEVEALIKQFAKIEQRKVAVPAKNPTGNKTVHARRTLLNFESDIVTQTVADADWVLRRVGNKNRFLDAGDLGVGRFRDDDGTRLDKVLTSLKSVGWLSERPDGKLEATLEWPTDGLLEPLWCVICEINRRAYEQRSEGVARDDLFQDLRNVQIGHDGDRRGGKAAKDVIDLARRIGIIDSVLAGRDGYALAVIETHPIARQAAGYLRALGQVLDTKVGQFMPEHEILRLMRDRDEQAPQPVFGHDVRDRQQVLRVLRRSKLIEKSNSPEAEYKLKRSAWLRKLLPGKDITIPIGGINIAE